MTNYNRRKNTIIEEKTTDSKVCPFPNIECEDCVLAKRRHRKLECINGISYRNTYNDLNVFGSYRKTE